MRNHEVTELHGLLDERGNLSESGWSRRLVQRYDRSKIQAPNWRIKEWDYYLVMGRDFAGGMAISPKLFYYGRLCGATLGGNLTPISASANIAGIGILRREGYEVKAGTFMKFGIPFTLAAVITGYVLIWFIWA